MCRNISQSYHCPSQDSSDSFGLGGQVDAGDVFCVVEAAVRGAFEVEVELVEGGGDSEAFFCSECFGEFDL